MRECSILIPADFRFNASLRALSEDVFLDVGFDIRDIQRLVLVFDEVFMNAIKYGSDGVENSVHIFFEWIPKEYVLVRIEDEGKTVNKIIPEELKKKINREFSNPDMAKSHGRGLAQIALNLTDDLKVSQSHYGGISIAFQKQFPQKHL